MLLNKVKLRKLKQKYNKQKTKLTYRTTTKVPNKQKKSNNGQLKLLEQITQINSHLKLI